MPAIDVSELLDDPDFVEILTIKRRLETVDAHGRSSTAVTVVNPAPLGVVIPQNDPAMLRGPDQQNLPRLLQVHTRFRLRGVSKDPTTGLPYQPDTITWNGDDYVVNKVQDFSHFGSGFIQADCSSVSTVDMAPV